MIRALFIDDGGVISDNGRRAPEWQRLLGEFLPAHLGGIPSEWARANRSVVAPVWDELFSQPLDGRSFHELYDRYLVRWLEVMCDLVGVEAPSEEAALELAWEASRFVVSRASCSFPGVAEAVTRLAEAGRPLHTASGESSWELEGYLTSAGVRDQFGQLFGVDLAGELKGWPRYYAEVFRQAGVSPTEALVVDDSPKAVAQAAGLGAATVLITAGDHGLLGAVDRVLEVLH